VSVGDVVYPAGGRLGPRWQHDVELVLVHTGSARVTVDGTPRPLQAAGSVGLLLPGHREHFAFADREPTHHSWVQARLADPPPELLRRLGALPVALPASTALTELVREAVAVARTPPSTAVPLLVALAAAALWRYVGEAESGAPGAGDTVARARRLLHARLADPDPTSARSPPPRTSAARTWCAASARSSA
jgi:AraC family transcriptional regulator of arabinose operon